jgi:hypothetical protein
VEKILGDKRDSLIDIAISGDSDAPLALYLSGTESAFWRDVSTALRQEVAQEFGISLAAQEARRWPGSVAGSHLCYC